MWSVIFEDAARKAFKKLDRPVQASIAKKLEELSQIEDPGILAKPLLHDLKGRWRLRVGGHRVIFKIERQQLVILVVDVGRRDTIYDQ